MKKLVITMVGTAAGILLAMFIVMLFVLHACASAVEDLKKDREPVRRPSTWEPTSTSAALPLAT